MNVEVALFGSSHDNVTWPNCRIKVNDNVMFDSTIEGHQVISFDVDLINGHHTIFIEQYGKKFGENREWHTRSNSDRYIEILDLKLGQVSVKPFWHQGIITNTFNEKQLQDFNQQQVEIPYNQTVYDGYDKIRLSFNGTYSMPFETPVYDWLILSRIPMYRVTGRLKESSLTSVANWRLDYITNSSEVWQLFDECKAMLEKIK